MLTDQFSDMLRVKWGILMQLFGLKTCDTCRKALKALPHAEFVDVRVDGVSEELLSRAYDRFGDALVNTRSTTWRGLGADERMEDPLALLARHPTLMKRPLIVEGDQLWLGWSQEVQRQVSSG